MQHIEAKKLFSKYQMGQCTPEEQAIVENWLTFGEVTPFNLTDTELAADLEDIQMKIPMLKPKKRKLLPLAATAACLVLCGSLYLYISNKGNDKPSGLMLSKAQDLAPGGNKATLTLADGRTINLSDAKEGELVKQAGVNIVKAANGQLIYNALKTGTASTSYNMVSTPRGGQYQVVLPDGSRAWLNAASSLKFPASFKSMKTRKVELIGEAYFEIAKDKDHPFIVESKDQVVEVLGTHFNISNYAGEETSKTTLLEGAVRIAAVLNSKNPSSLRLAPSSILQPGQQAKISKENIKIANVDAEADVAWKNGYFKFTDNRIEDIMRQVSRWYDVEVSYEGKANNDVYSGRISRFKNISQVLKMIESAESVHFKVEGRRITVIQ
ncbi:FecR family protein [Pedobacter nyackensis]|uniref:FecR family protein n=1 Tax=Pedobacter nyackensis TaxID=475255 RepID=UPI00293095A2|nr:FecR domain-containing protein [Pedobacter nyackensis]